MDVAEAVRKRMSVRAFKPDPVPGETVARLLTAAAQAPSGGNLQPWRVHALAGAPLAEFKALVATTPMEEPEYDVYPPNLWDPFRTRRFVCGEDLYASIEIPRDDRPARFRQLARNTRFFDAPVGLFFCLDRQLGLPQWADLGMFMQTFMLLATAEGLATCAQEYWARYPKTVAKFVGLPDDHMLFSGMALGYADETAPINNWRTRRDPPEVWLDMRGFELAQRRQDFGLVACHNREEYRADQGQGAQVASRQQLLDLVDHAYDLRMRGDKEGVAALCADGAVFRVAGSAPGMPSSPSPAAATIAGLIDAFTFHSVKRLDAIVEADRAAVRLEVVVSPRGGRRADDDRDSGHLDARRRRPLHLAGSVHRHRAG